MLSTIVKIFVITVFTYVFVNCAKNTTEVAAKKSLYQTWKFENCSFENIDKCAKIILFYGARDVHLARNVSEQKEACVEMKSGLKCASDWSKKCLKGLPRQIINLMINGPKKNIHERCESKGTNWYLRSYKCVTDSRPDIDNCMDELKDEFGSIRRNPNLNDWLPSGCCFFSKFMKCFDKNIKNFCDQDGVKYLHWCRDAYLGDMVDLICNKDTDFESEKCSSLLTKIPKPAANETVERPESVLLPVYQMFMAYENTGGKDFQVGGR